MNSQTLGVYGPNAGFIEELYERFQANPLSVDAETRAFFQQGGYAPSASVTTPNLPAPVSASAATPAFDVTKVVAGARIARMTRELGHLNAHLDPLGSNPPGDPALGMTTQGLTPADLEALPASVIGGPCAVNSANALQALTKLRAAYSGSIGYEDDHVQIATERDWLREAVESGRFLTPLSKKEKTDLLMRLAEVDGFEQFLHTVQPFQGEKRFSIEGCDVMVPVLETIIQCTAQSGTREVVIGMAHRGRLNVLAHILDKPYAKIFADFPIHRPSADLDPAVAGASSPGYSGDVKYHKGYTRAYAGEGGTSMPITLAPNPSHLEFVNPVVVGRARAAQETRTQPGEPLRDSMASLAITIHGDAAFPGQGVVAETLNMGGLKGYSVGGTIHIIANNQIGFTTDPSDARSTLYSSDLAKGFEIPIVHVNADDPAACVAVARMACAYHRKFGKDFLIDLIGYRRLGHNETDEPRFTQPRLYARIDAHPRPREVWAKVLIDEGTITQAEADAMVKDVREKLMAARAEVLAAPPEAHGPERAHGLDRGLVPAEPASEANPTPVAESTLRELNDALHTFPEGFNPPSKLVNTFIAPRRAALDGQNTIVWAHAEALAYASMLSEGVPIRLTGQDVARGTFTQRHLTFHDPETGNTFTPLQNLPQAKASLALHNSPLSEQAAVGFEYGYSIHATETLLLWEGQFGDFANGAQVIIDQFIASGNAKWQQSPSLVMLLPHGYEGQGPEHSSARMERFLQLCAGDNMIVANCSTAAQYYHLLRRQGAQLQSNPRPLMVFTPKSGLRHPRMASSLSDLTEGTFHAVLDDPRPAERKADVTRLILCTGKISLDLVYGPAPKYDPRPEYASGDNIAIARVEKLYPFPAEELKELIASYPSVREIVWVQEEPQNMGAWSFLAPRIAQLIPSGVPLRYVGRPEASSPAEGKLASHLREQARIVAEAYQEAPALAPANSEPVENAQPYGGGSTNGHKNGVHKNGASQKSKQPVTELTEQRTEAQTDAH